MTFRELLQGAFYKEVFNILYREHYNDKRTEEVHGIANNYIRIWDELLAKPSLPNKEYQIYIREIDDLGERFIDVCLFCNEDDETYAMDMTPWGELIDAEVKYESPMPATKALAHILWEITFYGFREEDIKLEKDNLKNQIERIESGEEKLIPWEDVKKELDIDEENS